MKVYYRSLEDGRNLYTLWRETNPPFPFDGGQTEYRVFRVPDGETVTANDLELNILNQYNHVYAYAVPGYLIAQDGRNNVMTLYYKQGVASAILAYGISIFFTDATGNILYSKIDGVEKTNRGSAISFNIYGEILFLRDPALRIDDYELRDSNNIRYRTTDVIRETQNYSSTTYVPLGNIVGSDPIILPFYPNPWDRHAAYTIICVPAN